MSLKIFAKRIAPFIAAFAVGLFIASFFVSVAMPEFRFGNRRFQRQEMNRLEFENQELRENSFRMKRHIADLENQKSDADIDVLAVPPPPPMPPAPPKTPVSPRVR